MKTMSFEKLYSTEFLISEPLVKPQYWRARGDVFSAVGKPKVSHTLLWFKNCRGTIVDTQGREVTVEKNGLAYMAKGIEYTVLFEETNTGCEDTVVIHFQMTDKEGEDIAPTLFPTLCMRSVSADIAEEFEMLAEESQKSISCTPRIISVIYRILAEICGRQKRRTARGKYACILTGIEMLEEGADEGIAEIAARCGVSECYFRRLFKEYSGESPAAFRCRHRIERAKKLLLSDEQYTVGQIAQELGFLDVYHFSKSFKKEVGVSPRAYAEQKEKEKG